MEKGKEPGTGPKKARARSSSVSETGSGPTTGARTRTATTASLMEESSRMSALAATASQKAHQRKMTDFMSHRVAGAEAQGPSGGAGELPSGPCGPTAAPNLEEETAKVLGQLRALQEQKERAAGASGSGATASTSAAAGGGPGGPEEDGGGWTVWTNRKNRRIGEPLEVRDQDRARRGQTPFQLPGQMQHSDRGYYTSAYKRNQAQADQYRSNKSSSVAALTDRQWVWFKKRLCINCGMDDHQVKGCPHLASKEEGLALLRAALRCPEDMRPQGTGARSTGRAPNPGAARRMPPPPSGPPTAQKRTRETGPESSTGLTPEAKKAKQFSDAVRNSLTLYVREKDGTALTEERYYRLKTSFTYFVEDMLAKNKDPPICSGRWTFSRSVVKIPMAGEEDILWMRCFLEKAYLVQTDEEFNRSKGKVYVAYLRDRLEPDLTGMRPDKLSTFVRYYRNRAKIEGLFDLKMAAKTPKGKAVHLVMDEKAEEIFVKGGCQIPFASSGFICFEERSAYVARIRAQERQRFQPKPSELQKGLMAQEMDVSKMVVDDDEVVEVARTTAADKGSNKGEPEKPTAASRSEDRMPKEEALALARELRQQVQVGATTKETAKVRFMEMAGQDLDEVLPRRTVSSSSWHEEVEMAKSLEVPEAVTEDEEQIALLNDNDDDDDQARFELRRDHRAEGSSGVGEEGAAAGR